MRMQPGEPQQKPVPKTTSVKQGIKPSDFSDEYTSKAVKIRLGDGSTVEGILADSTKYWFKISVRGKTLYVNKAWVVIVEPV